jgi:hypothetical protein
VRPPDPRRRSLPRRAAAPTPGAPHSPTCWPPSGPRTRPRPSSTRR